MGRRSLFRGKGGFLPWDQGSPRKEGCECPGAILFSALVSRAIFGVHLDNVLKIKV
jgi:hypothetical protein